MMVHDWGGPIGFAVAGRHPQRFTVLVIGNTFAWTKSDLLTQVFSRTFRGPICGWLILKRNLFVETILPANVRMKRLQSAVMDGYLGPLPTPESRKPQYIFARQNSSQQTMAGRSRASTAATSHPTRADPVANPRHRIP
jgi:haloalkane dehalogenase